MGFTSYAQNFEDVMLWRALSHVTDGFYVDIGAQDPVIDSVSKAFYDRGWRGVHVEPVPAFVEMLRKDRPDEVVLPVALGEREGTLELNVFADTGLSTAIASYAERHQVERNYQVERIQVPMLTFRSALGSLSGRQLHWLKIDVEGFEEQVLRGWDSQQLRPWILVIEATIPNSTETDFHKWDPLVVAAGYRFVYFDGLNRFYIANEHPELAAAFAAPPNVFDAVEVSGLASWGLCNVAVAEHEGRIRELTERLDANEASSAAAEVHAEELRAEIAATEARAEELQTAVAAAEARVAERETVVAALSEQLREVETMLNERERQQQALAQDLATSQGKVEQLEHHAYYWWHSAEELRQQAGKLREELLGVYNSKSWRMSAPLRTANAQTRGARTFAGRALRWALRQPARIRSTVTGKTGQAGPGIRHEVVVVSQPATPGTSRRLPPRAARLYAELKEIVEKGTD
jgi:FkbM family methyltransferase